MFGFYPILNVNSGTKPHFVTANPIYLASLVYATLLIILMRLLSFKVQKH